MPNHPQLLYGSVAIVSVIAFIAAVKWTSRKASFFGFWEVVVISLCTLVYLRRGAALLWATLHNKPLPNQSEAPQSAATVHSEVDGSEASPMLVSTEPTEPETLPGLPPTAPSPITSALAETSTQSLGSSSSPPSLSGTSDYTSSPPSSFAKQTSRDGSTKVRQRSRGSKKADRGEKPSLPAWLADKLAQVGPANA